MPSARRWLVLAAVIAAFTPVVVDMTILHIAVPSLTVALGATSTEVLWIIDIYPLVMAGLLVPMGTLGDRIGHRRVMLAGLSVFTLASVAAAFSATPAMLIASRALLAVGGSMIMPAVLAIVRQTFEDEGERARALGIWTVVGSAGGAVGPLAGGFLLEHFWWGSVFLVNVPIMALVLPLAYRILPAGRPNRAVEWRIGQAVVLLVGLVAIMGGAPAERAGGAGALESTGFELGGALGITAFGVLVGAIYRSAAGLPAEAGTSIGEAAVAASRLDAASSDALMATARNAFQFAHVAVLQGAAVVVLVLAAAVLVILRGRMVEVRGHG